MISSLLIALAASGAAFNPVADTVTVDVPVEHQWLYLDKKACRLNVNVTGVEDGADASLRLDLVTDLSLMSEKKDTMLTVTRRVRRGKPAVKFNLGRLQPGFYQVNLSFEGGNAKYSPFRVFNIGVRPEEIVSPQDRQPDFDEFWQSTLAELAQVPMEPVLTKVPERSDSLRTTYTVKMKSWGGEIMGGILCVPNKPGKYPTYIDYLGYGANPIWYEPSANPETVEFLVSVRDQGILKRKDHYRWIDRGLSSKETFYYRGAFADVVRAIDYVCSLDQTDPERLFARGESQGGAFALVSVSLDHRIKACAPAVPFLNDFRDYSCIVRWPMWEVFDQCKKEGIEKEDLFRMLTYFDVKNFTDRIQCPVFMSFGLQDATCPPHTNFAGYNMIKTPKHWYCSPKAGHGQWAEKDWHAARAEWFRPFERR